MHTQPHDRWLLPNQQAEYPARSFLPEATLHGRREATYLVLTTMFLIATAALILFDPSRVIDVSAALPGVEIPIAMLLPVGVIPFVVSFVAIMLVGELFGRRRATALLWVGLFTSAALVLLMRLADGVDGRGTFASSLAFAGGYAVAHVCNVWMFDALRRQMAGRHLWLRLNGSLALAQLAGWAAFGAVHFGYAESVGGAVERSTLGALAIGSATYTIACGIALTIPLVLAARGLALFLRVERTRIDEMPDRTMDEADEGDEWPSVDANGSWVHANGRSVQANANGSSAHANGSSAHANGSVVRRLPPAQIVDGRGDVEPVQAPRRRRVRASIQPFSSAEMRFFTEGDQLAD